MNEEERLYKIRRKILEDSILKYERRIDLLRKDLKEPLVFSNKE